jgi:hypothetical protein
LLSTYWVAPALLIVSNLVYEIPPTNGTLYEVSTISIGAATALLYSDNQESLVTWYNINYPNKQLPYWLLNNVGSTPIVDLNSVSGWVETIQNGEVEDFIEPVLEEVIPLIDDEDIVPPVIEIIDEIE